MLTSTPEAAYDELPEDLRLQARALGYSSGDRVMFTYDSSEESTTVVPR